MRRFLLIFIFTAAVPAVYSETVLLYIGNDAADEDTFNRCLPLASALEEGVMSEFFDHGHIIFNAGIKPDYRFAAPPFKADRLPVRIAKAGGASYLLEVNLDFSGNLEDGTPPVLHAEYVFSQLKNEKVLQKGTFDADSSETSENEKPEQISYHLGMMIALQALETW